MELLRNSKDKKARKLTKKRVRCNVLYAVDDDVDDEFSSARHASQVKTQARGAPEHHPGEQEGGPLIVQRYALFYICTSCNPCHDMLDDVPFHLQDRFCVPNVFLTSTTMFTAPFPPYDPTDKQGYANLSPVLTALFIVGQILVSDSTLITVNRPHPSAATTRSSSDGQ